MLAALILFLQASTQPFSGVAIKPGDVMIIRPEADGTISIVVPKAEPSQEAGPGEVRIDLSAKDGKTGLLPYLPPRGQGNDHGHRLIMRGVPVVLCGGQAAFRER